MKIDQIDPIVIAAGSRNWVIIKITTDNGIIGIGEATLEGRAQTIVAAVNDMSRYLLGKDPLHIEHHYQYIYRGQFWRGGPVLMSALSGIEQALWDIVGKYLQQPVYNLWGGPVRQRIKLYANGWLNGVSTIDGAVSKAKSIVELGFKALKLPGFAVCDGLSGKASYRWGLKCVYAVREAVGPDIELMVDMHGRATPAEAITLAREYEKVGLHFFEEPIAPENIQSLAEIRQRSPIPIASGERLFTRFGFREVLEQRAVDIIQPDLCHCGGLFEARKIAAMAEAYNVNVAPHNPNSPVSTAACVQFATTTHNFDMLEIFAEDVPWREEIFPNAFQFDDGHIIPSTQPGLGIEWNEAAARNHPYEPMDLPVCHMPDGTVAEW